MYRLQAATCLLKSLLQPGAGRSSYAEGAPKPGAKLRKHSGGVFGLTVKDFRVQASDFAACRNWGGGGGGGERPPRAHESGSCASMIEG